MKGILGRKVGMTQVFSNHGEAITVTAIEVKPNIVTSVATKEKNGYSSLQLSIEDMKKSRQKKPALGHFKKANTIPKRFIREIRNMEGFKLGDQVKADIFAPGELVDVTGVSKGKGFAGAIKRHNQSIGPKSHGGGGGSQPVRQTGSLGDIAGNKVVKGMTMPGHMGHNRTTVQNLIVVSTDIENNILLVKGSIPGPKKSFVIIKQAVKGLPNKDAFELVNVKEAEVKNELLEHAKKAGANVNTDMSINEMKAAIKAASEAKEATDAAAKAEAEAEKLKSEQSKIEVAAKAAVEEVAKAKEVGDDSVIKEAEQKAKNLESQAHAAEVHAKEAKAEAKIEAKEAAVKEAAAEELQVETDNDTKDESKKGGE